MRSLTRAAIFIAAILSALLCAMARPPAQQSKQAPPAGSIFGRVTLSGKPAPNIKVILMPSESDPRMERATARDVTEADGRFQLTSVPAGSYYIIASAPAYYSERTGMPREQGTLVTLEDGETVEGINIALRRGGVITGRVTDASGRPLIRERISLDLLNDQRRRQNIYWTNFWMFQTDDRGVYRLYGLAPGRYLVSAGVDKNRGIRMGGSNSYYERTFHPGVTDESKATLVELAEGGEATGIDIAMGRAEKAYTASGRIVDAETGKPLPDLMCGWGSISPDGRYMASMMMGARSNAKGEFRIEGLVPARYAAFFFPTAESEIYGDPVPFEIIDADVTGIELKASRGSSISGIAVIEGTNEQETANKLSETSIGLSVATPSRQLNAPRDSRLKLSLDGSFRAAGLRPGKAHFFMMDYPPKGFHLLRVERDGVEQPEGIDIAAGENISGVKIVIAHGTGVIRGQLKFEEGLIPEGARLIVSGRRMGDTTRSGSLQIEADARGRFVFNGLLPGEYEISASGEISSSREIGQPPRLRPATQKVTVVSGAESQVVLTLEPEAKNN